MGKGGEKMILQSMNAVDYKISEDKSAQRNNVQNNGFTGKLGFAIAASAIGPAFQHGYNTGVINNPKNILEEWMTVTLNNRTGAYPEQSTITLLWSTCVAIFCIGGMIGGALTGFVAFKLGRKGGLLWNNVLVLLATLCLGLAKTASSIELLIIGRFIIGINAGLNAGLCPMYLNEISPINLRGAIGTVYQLVITISILVSQVFGIKYLFGTEEMWPLLFSLIIVPGLFQAVTLPFCPESPKFLISSKDNTNNAQKALIWLRNTRDVKDEMDSLKAEADAMKLIPKVTIRELITNPSLRAPLIIALTIMLAQQLSGINAVMFFSTKIFEMAGFKGDQATFATLGIGSINVVTTIASLFLVEIAGRKSLLLIGFAGMTVITFLLAICLIFVNVATVLSYCAIILVGLYVIMFACGPGSIPWFLVAEIFNQAARPPASSLAVCINWTANFLVGLAFLPIEEKIHAYVFLIFVALDALFLWFIIKKVPETKNKTIEEINAMFRQQSYQ